MKHLELEYKKGDVLNFDTDKPTVIIHIVNNMGGWGAGFVIALSNKWEEPEQAYLESEHNLGDVGFVKIPQTNVVVANMCAQILGYVNGKPPIRYEALEECLNKVGEFITKENVFNGDKGNYVIRCPKIGAGLAGGDWNIISKMLQDILVEKFGINTTVFELV